MRMVCPALILCAIAMPAIAQNDLWVVHISAPAVELVTRGSARLSNGTLNDPFAVQANLSTSGSYTNDATVFHAADTNPTGNAYDSLAV